MDISDDELRSLVRDAISRASRGEATAERAPAAFHGHASHFRLPLARGSDGDGACLIEPTVRCNHCGYCLSLGH
jgi:hypothetical protein